MRSFAKLAAVAAIPSVAFAVQIADFTPRVYNLPSACYILYNATSIPGCQASDFQGGHGCSTLCVAGMSSMVGPIQLACANANVPSNTPLGAFISGSGVHDLCPNAPAPTTTQQQTTQAAPSTTSTQQQPTTTEQQPTTTDTPTSTASTTSTSATPVIYSSSTTTSSSASSTSSTASSGTSAQSTSSSSSSSMTSALSSSSSSTTQTGAASTSSPTNNSGGGSPFDVTSSNDAIHLSNGSGYTFALFLSALLAGYAL